MEPPAGRAAFPSTEGEGPFLKAIPEKHLGAITFEDPMIGYDQ
jgi:hypothetical protein